MAAKDNPVKPKSPLTKRKQISGVKPHSISKRPKLERGSNKPSSKPPTSDSNPKKKKMTSFKPKFGSEPGAGDKKAPMTKQEGRKHAKELAEARKKKRKRHYTLEQELATQWEKMRVRNISKEDRSKLVSEAIQKMKGKIPEIAGSHIASRVLQTCVKHCSQSERDLVFEELQPHFLSLSTNTYAIHLVMKMLDSASKNQLATAISAFRGHVASLLRHMVGSVVIEHTYQVGNATQKQELLMELYSAELQLFKDLATTKVSRLTEVISKLKLQKTAVVRHLNSVIQPILEKGIVDHSIVHRLLLEFLSIADKTSATDVLQQLSSASLVRMIHTRDGYRVGMLCVKHGSAKERKKIVKGLKEHVQKIARDQYGSMVLVCILSIVDDTKLVTKVVINGVQEILKDLLFDKNGRRILLQLLHPNCSRYFTPEDLDSFDSSVPSLSSMDKPNNDTKEKETEANVSSDPDESVVEGGKKDPLVRRQELLVKSGLAEKLVDVCIENAGKLLQSNFGKDVIYEVVTGGADGILVEALEDKLKALNEAIACLVAEPKSEESEEEHALENFHSSRVLRKLILNCPGFASTLWKTALKGKSEIWASGHSGKVIAAFLESSDSNVRKMAQKELQGLVDRGLLKITQNQASRKVDDVEANG